MLSYFFIPTILYFLFSKLPYFSATNNNINNNFDNNLEFIEFYGIESEYKFQLEDWKAIQYYNIPTDENVHFHWNNIKLNCDNNAELIDLSIKKQVINLIEKLKINYHYNASKILLVFNGNKIVYQINDPNITNNYILVCRLKIH